MKKGILTLFATVALLAGTTVTPANAQWWGPYGGYYGNYYGHHHHSNWAHNLGWAAAGLGLGLGLSALSRARDNGYYSPYYGSSYYSTPLNLYSAPAYGYYGNYWY